MLTSLHTVGSLETSLGSSFCTLVRRLRVSIIYQRNTLSCGTRLDTNGSRKYFNGQDSSKRGNMDADDTYICLLGTTLAANLPAFATKRLGCAEGWRARYGLSAK